MRLARTSLVLLLLLVASLGAKGLAYRAADPALVPAAALDPATFLAQRGFAVSPPVPDTAPQWITGMRGDCRVRIADVWPQGWAQSIVRDEGAGQRVLYAFAGRLYDEQPVLMTSLVHYRQRLLRYLLVDSPAPAVRAILVSPACPPATIVPADAGRLS